VVAPPRRVRQRDGDDRLARDVMPKGRHENGPYRTLAELAELQGLVVP
jgi:hypothetical protein